MKTYLYIYLLKIELPIFVTKLRMKILGWMHRKLMHSSTELMKNPTIGSLQTLSEDYLESTKSLPNSNINFQKSSYSFEPLYQQEPYEPFDFLSIGTFGMELLNTEPTIETLTDHEQIEITENDLNFINYELEKFLDAQDAEDNNDTSERSSEASVISLSYTPIEGSESEGHADMKAFPLQSYLFAASVELVEREKEVKRERASLGELFKRTNLADDNTPMKKCEGEEKQAKKGNVAQFLKKVANKFHAPSFKNDGAGANPTKSKVLSKAALVKMFDRKVYPEEIIEKQSSKKGICCELDEKSRKKKNIQLCWGGADAAGHWIKTDSDYLVLEL